MRSGFLDVGDASLFYTLHGSDGPAIALVHGGMCDHRDWAKQVPALADGHRVLTLDLRGHGQSRADAATCTVERCAGDLNALIDEFKLGPATLVGHSLGARVVMQAAWRRPDNAAALVLVDGSRSHGGFAARAPLEDAPPPMQRALTEILNLTIGPYADDATRAHVLATMSAASPEIMAACVAAMRDWDLGIADNVRVDLPVLAIQSTYHDAFTPRRSLMREDETTPYLDFLRQTAPQLETAILTETGHFSMMERPERVTALIGVFAGKHAKAK